MKVIRHTAFFMALLYLTIYLPLFAATYFTGWYELNCRWHQRCLQSAASESQIYIDELVGFLRHTETLSHPNWSAKEKRHLAEARIMLDILFFGAVTALSIVFLTFDRGLPGRFAVMNIILILGSSAILPFFKYFWRHGFHRLVFNNTDWINYPSDISYHITPRVFFLNTFIFVLIIACTINCGIILVYRVFDSENRQTVEKTQHIGHD